MKENKLNIIIKLIINEYNPKKVILFGSRSKGTNSFNSDFDLAIDSNKIDFRTKRKFHEKIENIIGLHKIDMVYLNEIEESFRKIILKTGKILYER
jgi:predicted nucleotidyltransferase